MFADSLAVIKMFGSTTTCRLANRTINEIRFHRIYIDDDRDGDKKCCGGTNISMRASINGHNWNANLPRSNGHHDKLPPSILIFQRLIVAGEYSTSNRRLLAEIFFTSGAPSYKIDICSTKLEAKRRGSKAMNN